MTDDVDRNKKTERLHMLISPNEIEAIDTWRFNNRIATRADAVRRLTQLALLVDAPIDSIHHRLRETYVDLFSRTDVVKSHRLDRDRALKAALLTLRNLTTTLTPLMVDVTALTEQVHRLRADGKATDKTEEADEIRKQAEEKVEVLRVILGDIEDKGQPRPED